MKNREMMNADECKNIIKMTGLQINDYMKQEKKKRVRNYQYLNQKAIKDQILFTGSSLMEQFPINEIAMSDGLNKIIYNRGISGTTTDDFIEEIDSVLFDLEPSKVFINIGTNDFNERNDGKDWRERLLANYESILQKVKERLPETEVFVMAYYPVKDDMEADMMTAEMLKIRTNENLNQINYELKELAVKYGYQFIDVNTGIKDEQGRLRGDLAIEGIHMYANAYQIIYENLKPYL